jgi:hypothetical protein
MAAAAARSSRSNVEYFDSAGCSLREKKPNGCQDSCTCCCSGPPMCVSDASVARVRAAIAALGAGCVSGTAVSSTCLLCWNALSRAGDYSNVFLPPLRASVSGSRTAAIPGVKRREKLTMPM